jgi:FixJ family two-component response regulator
VQSSVVAVVDDDASVLRATQALLRSRAFTPLAYSSAEAFLHSSEGRQARCLILDVNLPGLSGVQLHEQLRQEGVEIPAILVTGGHTLGALLGSQSPPAGVVAILEKPFDGDELLRWVGLAVGHR